MGSKGKPKRNLAIRIITAPYRVICKARDAYVRSIMNCADHITYGGSAVNGPHFHVPRNHITGSFGSNDSAAEDLRDLIRANAICRIGDVNITRAEMELYMRQHTARQGRSKRVGMGRIDEDVPVGDDGKVTSRTVESNVNGFSQC